MQLLVDLGSGIFEGATVDSNILIYQKNINGCQEPFEGLDLSKEKIVEDYSIYNDRKILLTFQEDETGIYQRRRRCCNIRKNR